MFYPPGSIIKAVNFFIHPVYVGSMPVMRICYFNFRLFFQLVYFTAIVWNIGYPNPGNHTQFAL